MKSSNAPLDRNVDTAQPALHTAEGQIVVLYQTQRAHDLTEFIDLKECGLVLPLELRTFSERNELGA